MVENTEIPLNLLHVYSTDKCEVITSLPSGGKY